ncbi:MAG: hypothetical protein ABIO70_35435 [Pseudomonadota bacterium]
MRRLALSAILLLVAAPAFAQDEDEAAPARGRRFVVSAVSHIDFEKDLDVAGELVRPPGVLLLDRKSMVIHPMIELRRDFNDVLETSVDEVR